MGCCSSAQGKSHNYLDVPDIGSTYDRGDADNLPHWRIKLSTNQSKAAHIKDGTLPADASDNLVAARVFLEDPVSLSALASFAKGVEKLDVLLCWIEVLEYKIIAEGGQGFKLSKANSIYHTFFKADPLVPIVGLSDTITAQDRSKVESILGMAAKNRDYVLPGDLFDAFGHRCLMEIEEELLTPFRSTDAYHSVMVTHREQYNKVKVEDFDFIELLGQGGFGVVLHCKKKSTGTHYAMKIQAKDLMLNQYRKAPERVTFEREAVSKCHHPFIIGMDYAFQTSRLAIMVTELGTGDSLSVLHTVSEERGLFYTAEIVLALDHIHKMGMIYRDLKPANVLLNTDGHIQLVDLGGVVDVGGKTLGQLGYFDDPDNEHAVMFNETPTAANQKRSWFKAPLSVFDSATSPTTAGGRGDCNNRSFSVQEDSFRDSVRDSVRGNSAIGRHRREYSIARSPTVSLKRANSVMGTGGYMAPEMLVQLLQNNSDRAGYTKAVDYWSLGVTLFSLLTGSLPFRHQQVAGFISYAGRIDKDGTPVLPPEYKRVDSMLQGLQQQHKISAECAAVVRDFLEFDELKRLGGGKQGIVNVMAHPAFAKIEWALLEQKLVKPPFKGHVVSNCSSESDRADKNSVYESFHALLMSEAPDFVEKVAQCRKLGPREQMYFSNWDFVAPTALKSEMAAEKGAQGPITQKPSGTNKIINAFKLSSGLSRIISADVGDSESQLRGNSFISSSFVADMISISRGSSSAGGVLAPPTLFTPTGSSAAASFGTTKNPAALVQAAGELRKLNSDSSRLSSPVQSAAGENI